MRRTARPRPLRGLLVAGLAGGLVLTGGAASAELAGQEPPPPPSGGVSPQMLHDSVRVFDPAGSVRVFDPRVHVMSLADDVSSDAGETTIALSTDLLFRENTWELPANAPARIADLVVDVPEGASVAVVGHTDTQQPLGQDFDNQRLSENRAEAVAEALRAARPDLDLAVSGRGDSEPRATGAADDPSVHAANRRVEIVYAG